MYAYGSAPCILSLTCLLRGAGMLRQPRHCTPPGAHRSTVLSACEGRHRASRPRGFQQHCGRPTLCLVALARESLRDSPQQRECALATHRRLVAPGNGSAASLLTRCTKAPASLQTPTFRTNVPVSALVLSRCWRRSGSSHVSWLLGSSSVWLRSFCAWL